MKDAAVTADRREDESGEREEEETLGKERHPPADNGLETIHHKVKMRLIYALDMARPRMG